MITVVRTYLEHCVQFSSLPVWDQVQQKTIRMHRGLKDMTYKKKIEETGLVQARREKKRQGGGKHLIALLSYIKGDYREN